MRRIALVMAGLALGARASDGFWPAAAPEAAARAEVRVRPGNNMPLVGGELNGKPCTLLFDTGATHTTFDTSFIKKSLPDAKRQAVMLAGGTNVEGAPTLLHADRLTVGEATFRDFNVMCLDLSHLHGSVGARVDGVLGMNVIGRTRTRVALGRGEVVFGLPEAAREGFAAPARRVGFDAYTRRSPDPYTIELAADGQRFNGPTNQPFNSPTLIVDSGSTWTFLDASFNWPATTNRADLAATDINGHGGFAPRVGEEGTLRLLPRAALTIRPLLVDEPLNRLGADALLRYEMLVEARAVAFREAGRVMSEK